MISTFIFDMDGVLVDSVGFTVSTFLSVLKSEGIEIDSRFISERIGIGAKQVFTDILVEKKITYKEAYLNELVAKLEQNQIDTADTLPIFESFFSLIEEFDKVKTGLATMSTRAQMNFKLRRLGFNFDSELCADDVSLPKPHPDIYVKSAENLQVKAAECLVFEDSFPGVQAAKAAGMKCIGVTTGYYDEKALADAGADLIIGSLDELEKINEIVKNL